MRTYGRVYERDEDGVIIPGSKGVWTEVQTDANGSNDYVYLTTLCQVLQLNLNESPFYAGFGIPAHPAVIQQIFPDYFMWQTQRQFSPFFASLIIAKQDRPDPTYKVSIVTNQGVKLTVPIPA